MKKILTTIFFLSAFLVFMNGQNHFVSASSTTMEFDRNHWKRSEDQFEGQSPDGYYISKLMEYYMVTKQSSAGNNLVVRYEPMYLNGTTEDAYDYYGFWVELESQPYSAVKYDRWATDYIDIIGDPDYEGQLSHGIYDYSPKNGFTNKGSYTISSGYSFGGDFGFEGKAITGSIGGEVTNESETSYDHNTVSVATQTRTSANPNDTWDYFHVTYTYPWTRQVDDLAGGAEITEYEIYNTAQLASYIFYTEKDDSSYNSSHNYAQHRFKVNYVKTVKNYDWVGLKYLPFEKTDTSKTDSIEIWLDLKMNKSN